MQNRRNFLTAVGSAAVAAAVFGWSRPAWAPHCSSCKTTSLLLPLSGTFFYPPTPCVMAGENVPIQGDVHVVTNVNAGFLVDIYTNMAGVDGIGQTSGSMYIGTGAANFIGIQFPPTPCAPNPIQAIFALTPTNGCASVALPATLQLCFSSDGTLLPQSTVVVGVT